MDAAALNVAGDDGSPARAGYRRSTGSPRGEARRRELLDRVTNDLAVNGLVDFSLRRAARAAGTTHKVLLYHFDGADDLLAQAIFQLRERRIGNAMAAIAAGPREQTLAQRVRAVWPALLGEESRVLDQAIGLMMYDPVRYAELGRGASQQYLPSLLSICPPGWPDRRKLEVAEMILATLRGFLIDWLTSGNTSGVEAALLSTTATWARAEGSRARCSASGSSSPTGWRLRATRRGTRSRAPCFASAATSGPSRPNCPSCAGTCSVNRRPAAGRDVREAVGMKEIELSAGTIEYRDTGGDGPVFVLLHGLMMDASLWDEVIAACPPASGAWRRRCRSGAHRHAMNPDADLSLPGIARLIAEFLDRLDLRDVTFVGNDTGGALVQLLMGDGDARVGRVGPRLVRRVRQLPARPDRTYAGALREAPAAAVRAVHAADAAAGGAAAAGRVRLADEAG